MSAVPAAVAPPRAAERKPAAPAGKEKPQLLVVRRVKRAHGGGHHGGAWKVAYADFVTAMMAFFLVMWLVGTFLGILLGYGFIGPLASAMHHAAHEEGKAFEIIKMALVSSLRGYPPSTAVEFARKLLFSDVRPAFADLETHLRSSR